MSANNWFLTRKKAHDINEVTVTGTSTVRVGRTTDGHKFDTVVNITDPSANFTLTVPDGVYECQILLVNLTSNTSSVTVTLSGTTGSFDGTLDTAGDYILGMWINSTVGWLSLSEEVAS